MYVKDHTVRGRNKIQDYWCPEEYVVIDRLDETENVYTVQYTSPDGDIWEKTLHRTELKYPIVSTELDKKGDNVLNEQEEDVVFETQALNNDDLAELRPHDFSLPVSNVSDSTAVKEIEGRGLNVIGEVSDGMGTVDEGTEWGGTVQFGEINDNIVPNVEEQGDGKD